MQKEQIEKRKAEYRKTLYQRADEYANGVLDGTIICNADIRLAVERYFNDLNNPDYYINYDEVNKFWNFCYYIYIDTNKNQIVQFLPEPWQCFYFLNIYGFFWSGEKQKRRFTRSFLTISKKNGKTTIGVIQLLYATGKGNLNAQVYAISDSKVMSSNSSMYIAKNIIGYSPALRKDKRFEVLQYAIKCVNGKSVSTFKMLPNKESAMNSIKCSMALVDELHLMKTSAIVDKLSSGMNTGAIPNPLLSIIGTRGNRPDYYQYELETVYKRVLRKEAQDPTTFIMMFGQDSEDEVNKPELWIKSNPNLHSCLNLQDLQTEFEKAKLTPTSLREFFSFNLNMWVEGKEEQFIEQQFIDAAFARGQEIELNLEWFRNKPVTIGADLSRTDDLSSIVVTHYDPDKKHFYSLAYIYMANSITNRIRGRGIDLTPWIAEGHIKQSTGNRIDYNEIMQDLVEINNTCEVLAYGSDGVFKNQINPWLEMQMNCKKEYIDVIDVHQGIFKITPATALVDRIFAQQEVSLAANPCFKWQWKNARRLRKDNNNITITKNQQLDSIDSCIAFRNSIQLWRQRIEDQYYQEALKNMKPINFKI